MEVNQLVNSNPTDKGVKTCWARERIFADLARVKEAREKREYAEMMANASNWKKAMDLPIDEIQGFLLNREQIEVIKQIRILCQTIQESCGKVNELNVAFDLDLPPIILSELSVYFGKIDERINVAKIASHRLGIKSGVIPKVRSVGKNI